MKLVDDLEAQATLESLLDDTKPAVPEQCQHLHYLLFTPFRYAARHSTRFRRAGTREGVLYCAEELETAAAEIAFYRLLFFLESPETKIPIEPFEMTAFSMAIATRRAVDLSSRADPAYMDPNDYNVCHDIADEVRSADADIIRYTSARRAGGTNIAVFQCRAFSKPRPLKTEAWKFRLGHDRVIVLKSFGRQSMEFLYSDFADDKRIPRSGVVSDLR